MSKQSRQSLKKYYITVCTYMDKRRLCVAHPSRGQANLTRSWCNEVALCRTSSLQRAFKSCRWLVCRTRNTTAEGPSQLSGGNKSVRRIQPAADRSGSSPHRAQNVFPFFFFFFVLSAVSAFTACQLSSRAHRGTLSIRTASASRRVGFHAVKSSHRWSGPRMPLRLGEVAPLSFFTGTRC